MTHVLRVIADTHELRCEPRVPTKQVIDGIQFPCRAIALSGLRGPTRAAPTPTPALMKGIQNKKPNEAAPVKLRDKLADS